jgi:hypothetical protein
MTAEFIRNLSGMKLRLPETPGQIAPEVDNGAEDPQLIVRGRFLNLSIISSPLSILLL